LPDPKGLIVDLEEFLAIEDVEYQGYHDVEGRKAFATKLGISLVDINRLFESV
jgi:hypothetical protein